MAERVRVARRHAHARVMPECVSLADVQAARLRIRDAIALTPCPESIPLSEITGARVFCKLDNFQRTGSFKERGARNALLALGAAQRTRGVIAASAGNHALGLAYHGALLGVPVTVVMPRFAPLIKVATCRRLGAHIVQHGDTFQEAREHAGALASSQGLTYVHGYDDPAIIAGQGTLALEVLEQVPDLEAIVVPIGGGGLVAGVALVIKALRPEVRVVGVEPALTQCFHAASAAGRPVKISIRPTVADGLAVSLAGENAFALARPRIDQLVTVSEEHLALSILRMVELEKIVVEGAAAAPLAAMLSGQLPHLAGKRTVLVLGGGNIDPTVLSRVIEKGLVADGRLGRFTATISDRPGSLAALAGAIGTAGASIKEVTHDRAFSGPDVNAVRVIVTVETRDRDHYTSLLASLSASGIPAAPV